MRKLFLAFLIATTGIVVAQQPTSGKIELTHGWVKQKDGTKKSVKGLVLNYTARTVEAHPIRPEPGRPKMTPLQRLFRGPVNPFGSAMKGGPAPAAAETLVYSSETVPSSFAYLDPEEWVDPSSLDEVNTTPQGISKLWKKIRFATHAEGTTRRVIIRFRIFDRKIEAPAGQMDFTDEVADFGGYFTPNQNIPGEATLYEIRDDPPANAMSRAGVYLSDAQGYVGIQYRDDAFTNGEGPFELFCYNVYQSGAPPQLGSSPDGWYYDWEPLNGIYEDTEYDALATSPPPYSNLLFSIWVDDTSQTTTVTPDFVSTIYGFYQSGNHVSLRFLDTNTYNVLESFLGSRVDPNIGIEVTGYIPTSNPLSVKVRVDNTVINQSSVQRIFMYNYVLSSWQQIDQVTTMPGVPVSRLVFYGGALPLSWFVGPTNEVKVRVTNFRDILGSRTPCINQINRVVWEVGYL